MLTGQYHPIRYSSICFRKSLLDKIVDSDPGFFNPSYVTVDRQLFFECAYHGIIRYINESTTVYRIQKESVSISNNPVKSARFAMGTLEIDQIYFRRFLSADAIQIVFRHAANAPLMNILWERDKNMAQRLRESARSVGYKFSTGQKLILESSNNRLLSLLLRPLVALKLKLQK